MRQRYGHGAQAFEPAAWAAVSPTLESSKAMQRSGATPSRRAVRAVVFALVAAAVLTLVTYRAVRRGGSVWAMAVDIALALVALLTPIPVR